jgi:hypothetical protein
MVGADKSRTGGPRYFRSASIRLEPPLRIRSDNRAPKPSTFGPLSVLYVVVWVSLRRAVWSKAMADNPEKNCHTHEVFYAPLQICIRAASTT